MLEARSKGILGIIFHGTRFGAKVGIYAVQLTFARRKAIKAFARELRRMGLPDDAVKNLCAEYPNIRLGDLKKMSSKGKSSSD